MNILQKYTFLNTFSKLIILTMSVFTVQAKANIMDYISEPTFSIDGITVLIKCPRLSHNKEMRLTEDVTAEDNKIMDLPSRGNYLSEIIMSFSSEMLDSKYPCDLGATEIFSHHFRFKGGIDVQFCRKRKIRKKLGEIELHGPWLQGQDPIFKPYYEHKDSDYGLRLEYNPNKIDTYEQLARFLKFIKLVNPQWSRDIKPVTSHLIKTNERGVQLNYGDLFKITRLDLACDYPVEIDPCMFTTRAQKMSIFVGSTGVQTVNFGTRRSSKQLRVYNKHDEMVEQGVGYCKNDHLWRLELAYMPKPGLMIDDMDFYKDPFKDVRYYDYDKIVLEHDLEPTEQLLFLVAKGVNSNSIGLGVHTAINSINGWSTRSKERWRNRLKNKFADFGSITSPSVLFKDNFPAQWDALIVQLKGFFYATT